MIRRTFRFDYPAGPITLRRGFDAEIRADRQWAADALRSNPGVWALLGQWPAADAARQHALAMRKGTSGWQPFGPGFEVELHTMLGEVRIYARYVGADGGEG